MDRDQRNRFLTLAAESEPVVYSAFMLMGLAGLRLGEGLGLKWASVDLSSRKVRAPEQMLSDSTKTGDEQVVDLAAPLVRVLRELQARRREEAFRQGCARSPWVVLPWLSLNRPFPG